MSVQTSSSSHITEPQLVPDAAAGIAADADAHKTESSKSSETESEPGTLNDETKESPPEQKCTTEIDASASMRNLHRLIDRAIVLQSQIEAAEINPARMNASRKKVLQSSAERFKSDAEKWHEQNAQLVEGCVLLLNAHGDSTAPGVLACLHMLELGAIDLNSSMEAAAFDNAEFAKLFLQAAQTRVKFAGKLLTCKKCALVSDPQPFSKQLKVKVDAAQRWLSGKNK